MDFKRKLPMFFTAILSLLLSFVVICFLISVLNSEKNTINNNLASDAGKSISVLSNSRYLSCANLKTASERLNCQFPSEKVSEASLVITPECLKELQSGSMLIVSIYFLIIFALSLQVYIFISSFFVKHNSGISHHFSEWSINAPPMLGVLGTVIAFSIFIASSKEGDISGLFTESFYDAAKTTILGGTVYVLNFFLSSINAALAQQDV